MCVCVCVYIYISFIFLFYRSIVFFNILLVLGIHQSDLDTYHYIKNEYIYSLFFRFFSHMGYHRILVEFPVLYSRSWLTIHMEVPRVGVEPELKLPAYTTATATPDPRPTEQGQGLNLNPLGYQLHSSLLCHNGNSPHLCLCLI